MIIVDGMDKVGKSTLVKAMAKELKFIPFRLTRFTGVLQQDPSSKKMWDEFSVIKRTELKLITELSEAGQLKRIVFDRGIASEYAYLDKNEIKQLDYIWELDERLAKCPGKNLLILLHAPPEWIEPRLEDDEKQSLEEIKRYAGRFVEYGERTQMTNIQIDVTTKNAEEVFNVISQSDEISEMWAVHCNQAS